MKTMYARALGGTTEHMHRPGAARTLCGVLVYWSYDISRTDLYKPCKRCGNKIAKA